MNTRQFLPIVLTAIGGVWSAICLLLMLLNSLGGRQSSPELGPQTVLLALTWLALPGVWMLISGIRALRQPTKKR
jgi:hypothetical protein